MALNIAILVSLVTTVSNFTQHLTKGPWSPSYLIHRQLHPSAKTPRVTRTKGILAAIVKHLEEINEEE